MAFSKRGTLKFNIKNSGFESLTQLIFTCSTSTIETLEIGVKYVHS